MHAITSLRTAGLPPEHVKAVLADYLALERARTYRRACVTRFGALAAVFGVAGFGVHWLSPVVSWSSVAMCGVAPAWAWIAEMRREWTLGSRLSRLPGAVTDAVMPAASRMGSEEE
jgi:hypothetical protein